MIIKHSYRLRKYRIHRREWANVGDGVHEQGSLPVQAGTPESHPETSRSQGAFTVVFVVMGGALVLVWAALLCWMLYIAIF